MLTERENKLIDIKQKEIIEKLAPYHNLVVSEETFTETSKIRATLNKEKTALDTERKNLNKVVNAAYNSLTGLYDDLIFDIDTKLNAVENARRIALIQEIKNEYDTHNLPLDIDKVLDEKWLLRSTNYKPELERKIQQIKDELTVLKLWQDKGAYKRYLESGNLVAALNPPVECKEIKITTIKLKNVEEEQLQKITALLDGLDVDYEIKSE